MDVLLSSAILLVMVKWCQGSVQCLCSTGECQRNNDVVCYTDSLCYVQYTPTAPDIEHDGPKVVRGCTDSKTPLLCENQRPDVYTGSWPVLYCCNTDLCNKDAVPTLPTWASHLELAEESRQNDTADKPLFKKPAPEKSIPIDWILQQQTTSHITGDHQDTHNSPKPNNSKERSFSIHPLYIGVPVAGACVLLAIIIFAIYILRRQHRMYQEQYQRTQQLKRRPPQSGQDRCRYVSITTNNGAQLVRCYNTGCIYADSDRSSNGSESRLLAQV